jgi:hypothetical protein
MRREYMTVKELREKLAGFGENIEVVGLWERNDPIVLYIHEISQSQGTRVKLPNGKEGFTFDRNGPATCVLITVDNK